MAWVWRRPNPIPRRDAWQRFAPSRGQNNFVITVTESVGAAGDVVTRAFTGARTITESVSATDAVSRQANYVRGISESAGSASDSVARAQVLARTISESVSASASVARVFSGARGV